MSDWYIPPNEYESIWPAEVNTVSFNTWPRSLLAEWYNENPILPAVLAAPDNTYQVHNSTFFPKSSNAVNYNPSCSLDQVLASSIDIPSQNNVPLFATERICIPVEHNSAIANEKFSVVNNSTRNVKHQIDVPISISNSNVPYFPSTFSTDNSYCTQISYDPTTDEASKTFKTTQIVRPFNSEFRNVKPSNDETSLESSEEVLLMRHLPNYHCSGQIMGQPNSIMSRRQSTGTDESILKQDNVVKNKCTTDNNFPMNYNLQDPGSNSQGCQKFSSLNELNMKTYSLAVRNGRVGPENFAIDIDSTKHFPSLHKKPIVASGMNCLNNAESCRRVDNESQASNMGSLSSTCTSYENTFNPTGFNVTTLNNLISLCEQQNSIKESDQYSPQLYTSQIESSGKTILVQPQPVYTTAQVRLPPDDIYRNNIGINDTINFQRGISPRGRSNRRPSSPQVAGSIINVENRPQIVYGGDMGLKSSYIMGRERKLQWYMAGDQSSSVENALHAASKHFQNVIHLTDPTSRIRGRNSTSLRFQNPTTQLLQNNTPRSRNYSISSILNDGRLARDVDPCAILNYKLDLTKRMIINNIITGVIPNPNTESSSYRQN